MKISHAISFCVLAILSLIGLGSLLIPSVHAQGGTSQTMFQSIPGPLSACFAPAVGTDSLCDVAGVGWEQSVNGAAYVPFNQPGPAGTSPTITLGTVTTLSAGSPATITNVGTASALVLNFGIPVGATGGQGIPGPVQSFGSAICPIWNGGSGSIKLGPGCTQTTP